MGPCTIIAGQSYDYNLLLGKGSKYSEYVQTREATDNTMKVHTIGALTMRPTGNTQGSFYYFLLATRRRLHLIITVPSFQCLLQLLIGCIQL